MAVRPKTALLFSISRFTSKRREEALAGRKPPLRAVNGPPGSRRPVPFRGQPASPPGRPCRLLGDGRAAHLAFAGGLAVLGGNVDGVRVGDDAAHVRPDPL